MKEYLRPSSSDIWLNCPASVGNSIIAERNGTIDCGSRFSEEGTIAHNLANELLNGTMVKFENYPKEMVNYIIEYVDYVQNLTGKATYYGYEFRSEYKLISGQCDAYALINNTLHIIDLKYGQHQLVNPYQNKQLMTYAIIVMEHLKATEEDVDIKTISLHVYQPRMDNVAVSVVAIEELYKFQGKLDLTIANIIKEQGLYHQMGSHCTFCKGMTECSEMKELVFKIMTGEVSVISEEDKVKIILNESFILKQIKKLKVELTNKLRRGENIEGIKLINGRKSHKWNEDKEEAELINQLKSLGLEEKEIIKTELHSPAKIRERISKHKYQYLIENETIKTTITTTRLVSIEAKGEDLTRNQEKDVELLNFTNNTEGK